MRFLNFLCIIVIPISLFSQKAETEYVDLFYPLKSNNQFFDINDDELQNVFKEPPRTLRTSIWIDGQQQKLFLKRRDILSKKYNLKDSKNQLIEKSNPVFYFGYLEENTDSKLTLVIQKDDLFMSIQNGSESSQLIKSDKGHFSFQNQSPITKKKFGTCSSETDEIEKSHKNNNRNNNFSSEEEGILIYFEADYDLFKLMSQSINLTEFYIHTLFAQIIQIFSAENVDIRIAEIKVWDTPDPYDKTNSLTALNSFQNRIEDNFNGHLAHLLSGNSANHGGRAEIDKLCDKSEAHAYSNIWGNYHGISDFSWDPFVIAHEIGHNLGSRHTHDCVWGPFKNQVLDDCTQTNCSLVSNTNANNKGTIMSYCHLDTRGVSFSEGFGSEPGQVIRDSYNSCIASDGFTCETAIEITENGKIKALRAIKGYGATHTNADHAVWYKFDVPEDGKIKVFNCQSGIDSRLWIHAGDCNQLTIKAQSDDDCGNGGTFDYSSSIPQLHVTKGETIYLEWDDRWSDDSFDFYFKFGISN